MNEYIYQITKLFYTQLLQGTGSALSLDLCKMLEACMFQGCSAVVIHMKVFFSLFQHFNKTNMKSSSDFIITFNFTYYTFIHIFITYIWENYSTWNLNELIFRVDLSFRILTISFFAVFKVCKQPWLIAKDLH